MQLLKGKIFYFFLTKSVEYDNISYYINNSFTGIFLTTNTAGSVVERRILLIMNDEVQSSQTTDKVLEVRTLFFLS